MKEIYHFANVFCIIIFFIGFYSLPTVLIYISSCGYPECRGGNGT